MEKQFGSLDASIQERMDADNDFIASLETLSDEDKAEAIKAKKIELFEEEVGTLKGKAEKATKSEELANNYKKRAEKAEEDLKVLKGGGTAKKDDTVADTSKKDDLSWKDYNALQNAGIKEEEDIDEVVEYAQFKKISVTEALKLTTVKTMLAEKAEFRRTAESTNAGKPKRAATKLDDSKLIEEANKGNVPEKGSEEADRLFWARRGGKPSGRA